MTEAFNILISSKPVAIPLNRRNGNEDKLKFFYGWSIPEAHSLAANEGLPLRCTGVGSGRRYVLVTREADAWLQQREAV